MRMVETEYFSFPFEETKFFARLRLFVTEMWVLAVEIF